MSIDYYEKNADSFYEDTYKVDMSNMYKRFFSHLASGAYILDAGCGSGRDTKEFLSLGYKVSAFDASIQMVIRARKLTGVNINLKEFNQINEKSVYDGIWACASLLHVPIAELISVMQRLAGALKAGGVWYVSFKYGCGEREKDGRHFTDLDEEGLNRIVKQIESVSILEKWVSEDKRPGHNELWLNAILLKS